MFKVVRSRCAPASSHVHWVGEHALWPALRPLLAHTRFDYRELDPDVFGEELERAPYARAERIAVVALDAIKG